jgi:competence protein ComEC
MRALAVVVTVVLSATLTCYSSSTLDVHFVNVGHGDAIFIDCGDWEALLDAGRGWRPTNDAILSVLLEHVHDGTIELVILSHPHADHYGGFAAVLQGYDVLEAWCSRDVNPDRCGPTYRAFSAALAAKGLAWTRLECGDQRRIGCLVWTILSSGEPQTSPGDDNDNSLVLLLEYGTVAFLFAGDIQTGTELAIQNIGLPEGFLVLKVPHHGSSSSCSPSFLSWSNPELAIVSADSDDLDPAVVASIGRLGIPFLTTYENGTICISTDGTAIWVCTIDEYVPALGNSSELLR